MGVAVRYGLKIKGTLIFGYQKSDRIDFCVVFWDTKQNKKNIKQVKNLI